MIEIWHNPRCSKSRQALALLKDNDVVIDLRLYLEDTPNAGEIRDAHAALGQPPVIEMMRTGEKRFKELGLSRTDDDEALIQAMAENPILIERPLIINGSRAVIGRPPEKALELF